MGKNLPFSRNTVILYLDEVIAIPEDIEVGHSHSFGFLISGIIQQPWYLTCKAGGKADKSIVVLFQQFKINSGLVVESLDACYRDKLDKVLIAFVVLAE